jgi:ABC-type multidrug transport system ATPase subunit
VARGHELAGSLSEKLTQPLHEKKKPVIDLDEVTQHYGVRPVLRGISLHIERGEVVVILGPNGMGKSTLLGVMAGVLSPQRGTVSIDGRIRRSSEEEELAIRRMTVYLPDQAWLPMSQTSREFLLAVGRLYDVDAQRLIEHVDRLLDLFDLSRKGDSPTWQLSAGQKKKVALCSALVTEAPIMLLDEPFSGGLDPAGILTLKRVIQHLTRRNKATIVLTSPVPELVEEIATRIVVLHNGEILAFDTRDGLERLTGHRGNLAEVLERLIFPETTSKLKNYFQEIER